VKIENKKVVSIHYSLTDDDGQQVDSSIGNEPLKFLHGYGNIIAGLEEKLTEKVVGDKLTVAVPPEKGYGVYDESKKLQASRDQIEGVEALKIGMEIQTNTKDGVKLFWVEKIFGDTVILNGNHPLAGQNLNFDVEIVEVRDASAEELKHGHVHGPGGHQH